jgi:hypothetical protein
MSNMNDIYIDHTNSKMHEKVRCVIKQTKIICTPSHEL